MDIQHNGINSERCIDTYLSENIQLGFADKRESNFLERSDDIGYSKTRKG